MEPLIEPTRWQQLWTWVDRDFDHVRPLSLAPLAVIPSMPLAIAFAVKGSAATVEMTKWIAIVGVIVVFSYYLYRQSLNLIRFVQRRRD